MYSLEHILYIIISLIVVVGLVVGARFIKNQKAKDLVLLAFALLCFFFHISTMYTSFFSKGTGIGDSYDNQLFPIFFCNYMMYLLLIVALWWDKKTRLFQIIATFVAYGGIFGALITLFVTPPGIAQWGTFQSALSHSTMLAGCLFLFVGGYVKIGVYNLIPFVMGLLSCGVVGGLVELIFYLGGRPSPNAMYLVHGPHEAPFFQWWMFALSFLILIFAFTAIWERFTRTKSERWYKTSKDLVWYFPPKKINTKSKKDTKKN